MEGRVKVCIIWSLEILINNTLPCSIHDSKDCH